MSVTDQNPSPFGTTVLPVKRTSNTCLARRAKKDHGTVRPSWILAQARKGSEVGDDRAQSLDWAQELPQCMRRRQGSVFQEQARRGWCGLGASFQPSFLGVEIVLRRPREGVERVAPVATVVVAESGQWGRATRNDGFEGRDKGKQGRCLWLAAPWAAKTAPWDKSRPLKMALRCLELGSGLLPT